MYVFTHTLVGITVPLRVVCIDSTHVCTLHVWRGSLQIAYAGLTAAFVALILDDEVDRDSKGEPHYGSKMFVLFLNLLELANRHLFISIGVLLPLV